MKTPLHTLWQAQPPRQRTLIAVLALILAAGLYAWLVQAAGQAREHLRASVATLRAQSATLNRQADELARWRQAPLPTAAPAELATLLQARVDQAGLTPALTGITAIDRDHVSVAFGALPFADWLAWVLSLQTQHVRLQTCRIEVLAAPGQVSVSATFSRAGM